MSIRDPEPAWTDGQTRGWFQSVMITEAAGLKPLPCVARVEAEGGGGEIADSCIKGISWKQTL